MASQHTSDSDTTKRFEGPSVEEVLAEVRANLGADAEIVEANKIRSGGIGGFFAKESYEVVARPRSRGQSAATRSRARSDAATGSGLPPGIDEAAFDRAAAHVAGIARGLDAPAVAGAGATGPGDPGDDASGGALGLMDLVDRVSRAEQQVVGDGAAQALPSAPTSTGPSAGHDAPTIRSQAPAPIAFEPLGVEGMPRLSTEGGAFSDVLHRIATDAGPDIVAAVDRRLGSVGAVGGENPGMRSLTPVGPQARSRAQVGADESALPAPAPTSQLATAPAAAPVPQVEPSTSDLVDASEASLEDRTSRLLSWLERDNLPRTTVLTALRSLPRVPDLPQGTGVVVAVVGRRQEALKLCRRLAKAHDADPGSVVLASATYRGRSIPAERRIIDITDAARDRTSWRRRERPTFVAVEAPAAISASSLAWTRDVVTELEAHQVIGIAAASCKTEDIATWAERIGGVDALALTGVEETTSPYAVLALEIPVGWLDDVPASPSSWAELVLEGSAA